MSTIIRSATELDVPVILDLIRQLAEYEQLAHLVAATEERLRETLFGAKPAAEVLLADCERECAGFAVFFASYSTFLAQPGAMAVMPAPPCRAPRHRDLDSVTDLLSPVPRRSGALFLNHREAGVR